MRILLSVALSLFLFQDILSQKELVTISQFLHHKRGYIDEVIPVQNNTTNELSVFFTEGKRTHAYLFDEYFNKIDSLSTEDKRRKYKQVIGNGTNEQGEYIIYFSNQSKTKFAAITFSFITKETNFQEFEFELEHEKFIQTTHVGNAFYILTIEKKSSIFNTYRFENNQIHVVNRIDLDQEFFVDAEENIVKLYDLITSASGFYNLGKSVDIVKINTTNPTTLEVAAQPTKLYTRPYGFLISFDENKHKTQLLDFNLEQSSYHFYEIEKPLSNIVADKKKTNSFVHENTIYTIANVENLIYLQSKDIITGDLINEHSVYPQDSIWLKNSPIVQTGGEFSNHRELKKTEKIFRKINLGPAGISVFKTEDFTEVTYGGIKESKGNPALFFPGFGIPIAASGGLAVGLYINPAFFAFESFTNTKAIKIEALFDDSFQHIEGTIPKNAFDKIKIFQEKEKVSRNGKTIFSLNDKYIFGSYDSWKKTYTFWEF